ncbi:MAG: hypothetical protein IT425_11630 [Pirellulales bacterium]|nr:hypothetical protein [Pirellulales bacterium]
MRPMRMSLHTSWARISVGLAVALLAVAPARSQVGDAFPRPSYFTAMAAFYGGEYRTAERELRRETQHGLRAGQARWIDSICSNAMLGEVLFQEGRNAEALAAFDDACRLFLTYPDWLLQVKFQSGAATLRADVNRQRRAPTWGRSSRTIVLGQFPETEQVLVGDLDARQHYQQGGVVRQPMLWRVDVVEIMRMTALAMRRRNEILGPLAAQDALSKELSATLARGNLAPANHWSVGWIDLLRGLAQQGVGKPDEADGLLGRSLVVGGQFDHPLTGVALVEQGRIAMQRGDQARAAQLFAEAGFSAFYYDDWGTLTESTMLGWLNHLASGAVGVYPPLDPIASWAQLNRLQHTNMKLRLAQAESLLWLGQQPAGASLVQDAGKRLGEMRGALPAIHQMFLQAVVEVLQGKSESGLDVLSRAMSAQAGASLRNFQILRTSQMYDAGAVSPRSAVDFYTTLLADPAPLDWQRDPLDAMAVLQTNHEAAFERWFVAALERKDAALALGISERAKRRRYLATQPLGGRLLALRGILETPLAELSQEAVLQRQRILATFAVYQTLVDEGQKLHDQLQAGPVLASDSAETRTTAPLYEAWQKNAVARQQLLAQMAVRRLPTSCEFPPLQTTAELQTALGEGEQLIVFHNVAGNVYGFVVNANEVRIWQLPDARRLRAGLGDFLKAIGNFSANRQLAVAEVKDDAWRVAAASAYEALFADARLDFDEAKALLIVPDDLLWYLPFEVLSPGGQRDGKVLADLLPIRYGPTAALAVARPAPLRRAQRAGLVANELKFGGDEAARDTLVDDLRNALPGALVMEKSLPQPPALVAALLDELIVFDDIADTNEIGEAFSQLPNARKAKGSLPTWIGIPAGGPEHVVLTGVATEAERGLRPPKRSSSRTASAPQGPPGSELFQSLCNLMAGGARTILITRWRTNGRTNYDLVREYASELSSLPAGEAWQRATLLAREAPLDLSREPRIKRDRETDELPTANHPFLWAGYLLVDTGPHPKAADTEQPATPAKTVEPATPAKKE